MLRTGLFVALLFGLLSPAGAQEPSNKKGADQKEPAATKPGKSGAELVKADPNDPAAWNAYGQEKLGDISELIDNDPPKAIARLKEVQAFIKSHPATEFESQQMLERFSDNIDQLMLTAEIVPKTIAELAAEFDAKQADPRALLRYRAKLEMELAPLVYGDPEKAADLVKTAKQLFVKAVAHSMDKVTEQNLFKALVFIKTQEARIEKGQQIQAMEGKDAAPLVVDAWIKGKPLSEADLKGKVILLDFWAIWCGACIVGFPDLQEWQKEYADDGLVIVGVTRYFGFKYDAEKEGIVQSDEEVPPTEERIALTKFAEFHKLTHHLAVDKGQELFDYYQAQALPHMVLIGRDGKIAKTFIGGGKSVNAKIDAELKKLLGDQEPRTK